MEQEIKPIIYELEFYQPGSREDVWVYLKSDKPFMAFHVGDVVHPGIWPESESPIKALKIDELQHCIWETAEKIRHKIMIFSHEIINK